mgnify:CR=1 FL=1
MSPIRIIDSPISWALAGLAIGMALGVNSVSVWLVAIGLGLYVVYLKAHGPANQKTEGNLVSAGPAFMMAWLVGFVIHGLAF